jgi:UDP-GlcNAc:undecaprenyl-phosphate/decaprenyl-phosphate GlcNAc-1-phosphate transferase
MRAFLVSFILATVVSAVLTPFVRRLAMKLGAVSNPGGRNVNERTIPRLGGIAIFVACFTPLAGMFFANSAIASAMRAEWPKLLGLGIGGAAMCAVGVLDDTRRVRALYKLYVQIAVSVVAFACGYRIEAIALPLIGTLQMGIFALPVTTLWIVGIVNAINLIDGLDGLAGGVVFFAAVTNFVVAYVTGAQLVGAVMASTLGAVLGFLFFNFNPARIFMGDSGSYFLGFVLAAMSLAGSSQKASTAVSLLVPVLALGLPIVDTLFSMTRRVLEKRSIFSPDKGHIHHRLLEMGFTHRRAVLTLYGVSIFFTVAAVGVSLGRSWTVGIAILGASVGLIGIVRFVGIFEFVLANRRQKARLRSHDTELLRAALPLALTTIARASSEADVWLAVEAFRGKALLTCAELVALGDPDEAIAKRWPPSTEPTPDVLELASARFPLGRDDRARAALRFRWQSETGDSSPQSDVLLQVVVDVVAQTLERLGSAYAPRPAESPSARDVTASAAVATPRRA